MSTQPPTADTFPPRERDGIPTSFQHIDASSVSEALSLLQQYPGAKLMAGGTDNMHLMREGVLRPSVVINIKTISGLDFITSDGSGLKIGALTKIGEVEDSQVVASGYDVLSQAAASVATRNVRNMATVGGDLVQDVWCWYLRTDFACWRNRSQPGNICFGAIGDNRYYHSIFGGRLCYAVHPSDLAVALLSLDATAEVANPSGNRTVTIDQLIPGDIILEGNIQSHTLSSQDILTQINIPTRKAGSRGIYAKIAIRRSIDFALASLAANVVFEGNTVTDARLVMGGVSTQPMRVTAAESAIINNQITETVATNAANAALSGATPLTTGTGNAFRVDLAKGVVKQGLLALAAGQPFTY